MNEDFLKGNKIPFVYNDNKEFVPGKTPVYYSGPYWDEKEMNAAISTLLTGKWITAGEKTYKFERHFSKIQS